jgi:ABC-2 type transport system permease protein
VAAVFLAESPVRSSAFSYGTAAAWLWKKEWRELLASRAWWVMLALIGPLVGVSFIAAVRTYAEASGLNGTASGVGEAFSPLDGIWAPTFSAYEVAATFLLPFVAIRLVSGDRLSGALKLESQGPLSPLARMTAKAGVLFGGWLVTGLAAGVAAALWKSYCGSSYVPEIAVVVLGHSLNAGLTIALAAAAAAVAEHPSTAAILTLGFTVGTWVLSFLGAIHGGVLEQAAGYAPLAMVADFQHGLVRADVTLTVLLLTACGFALAAIWLRLGVPARRRVLESAAVGLATASAVCAATFIRASWDASESRRNSFPEADERALRQIVQPLHIEVHLAPEDGRRLDLEHRALSKLRRVLPTLKVTYMSATSIGLFEQTSAGYGEIWYDLGGKNAVNRLTTAEGVLETIYGLAGVTPQPERENELFRGHPLTAPPTGAAAVFFGGWPAIVLGAGWLRRYV